MKKLWLILILCSTVMAEEKPYRFFNSFNGGALSPLLSAREDISKYQSGCSVMENMLVLPQGGAEKRPGTEYIAVVHDANYKVNLIPFNYSSSISYMIEAGNDYMRFYYGDTNAVNAPVIANVGTEDLSPWDANLIAQWPFNDDSESNTITDVCNTHTGYLNSGITSDIYHPGRMTGCLDMQGIYYVDIADNAALTFDEPKPFSITSWVYVTDRSDNQIIISKWEEEAAREYRLYLDSDEKLHFDLADESTLSLDANLIAQWKLNDNADDTNVVCSNTDFNGVATFNTSGMHVAGKIEGAFSLDSRKVYDAVEIDDEPNFTFGDGSNDSPFTIAAWIYVEVDKYNMILSKHSYEGTDQREYYFEYQTGGSIKMVLFDESSTGYMANFAGSVISLNQWYFVVFTCDGTSTSAGMNLYINGSLPAQTRTKTPAYIAMENKIAKVVIGASGDSSGNPTVEPFGGYIDNVLIFNKELTSGEVVGLYASGSGTESLIGDYPYAVTTEDVNTGWRFIAVTSAGTGGASAANDVNLYIDGVIADATKHNYANYVAMEDTAAGVRIGTQLSLNSSPQYTLTSRIDNTAIFSKELNDIDINAMYSTEIYEIATVYDSNDSMSIQYIQSGDVIYLVHPNYPIQKLSRYDATYWIIEDAPITTGPFMPENTTHTSVWLDGTGDTANLIADAGIFNPNHVGSLWKLTHQRASKSLTGILDANATSEDLRIAKRHKVWTGQGWTQKTVTSVTFKENQGSQMEFGDGAPYNFTTHGTWTGTVTLEKSTDDGVTWQTVVSRHSEADDNITFSDTENENGDVLYRVKMTDFGAGKCTYNLNVFDYYCDGIVKVLSYTDANEVFVEIIKDVNDTNTTKKWAEGEFSTYRGFPKTVTFYGDRLMFGGNSYRPDTVWGSVVGDYENFTQGANDDDSISFTLSSKQINEIQWMSGQNTLLVGTTGSEWKVSGSGDEPLTPSNVQAKQQSVYGSSGLDAIYANDIILYFQRGAKKIRELAYSWETDSYLSPDMTILNPEITGSGIVDSAFQQIPTSILWCVRSDGNMATFAYERKEEITAWSKQITDGYFESVAVISGSPEDEVWVSVKRNIDGNDVRYIERFKDRDFDSNDNAYFVDCGKTYTTDINVISDLSWLEGESVFIFADSNIIEANSVTHTLKAVDSNTITLGRVSQTVHVGLPYTVQLKTMPLSWIAQGNTIQGRVKRINGWIVRWSQSGDFYVGRDISHKELQAITGITTDESADMKTFPPGYDKLGTVLVYQYSPEPLCLLALLVEFQTY